MNQMQPDHAMLDDVAILALGAMPPEQARAVREHLKTCDVCQHEYAKFTSAASLVGLSAQTSGNLQTCPSTLLKPRIMQAIRNNGASPRPARKPAWPAYVAIAACLAIAVLSLAYNAVLAARSTALAQRLAQQGATLSDLIDGSAKRYAVPSGEVVTRGSHAYIALHGLPAPPRGRVYQAWTLPKGSKTMVPSVTFVPDQKGVAVVSLPPDARTTAVVAVSIEPAGGSEQPTTKPIFVVPLT
jgi:anti-sigma-K factor RskA